MKHFLSEMFKLLKENFRPLGTLHSNINDVSSSLISVRNLPPYFTFLFIDGLAVVLISIDANRLGAGFPGPLGQSRPPFRYPAYLRVEGRELTAKFCHTCQQKSGLDYSGSWTAAIFDFRLSGIKRVSMFVLLVSKGSRWYRPRFKGVR